MGGFIAQLAKIRALQGQAGRPLFTQGELQ